MGRESDAEQSLREFTRLHDQTNQKVELQRYAARPDRRCDEKGQRGTILPRPLKLLEKARDMDEGNASILFRLSGLYFQNQQYQQTESSIQHAIGLAPAQWEYHYLQGLIREGVGEFDSAKKALKWLSA